MSQTIFNQITRHGAYTDITVKNTGATSITAGLFVQFETSDTGSDHPHVKAIAAGDTVTSIAGVAVDTIAAGAYGRVCVHGSAAVLCNAVLNAGAFVQTLLGGGSCDGKAIALVVASTQEAVPCCGMLLTPSGGTGDYAELYVNISPVTTAA
jgi:hypothetical protein